MRIRLVLVALVAALVPIASGGAALAPVRADVAAKKQPDVRNSPDLWATINVCDTAENPNVIGIRGSMPGVGRRASLWMRFQVQFRSNADGKWHNLTDSADSKWKKVGRTRNRVIESGHNFTFLPPKGGGMHTLRGAVTFKWVRRGRIVRKLREITEGGHRSTAGADPPGFSAAICQIS